MRRVVIGAFVAAVVLAAAGCQDDPETGQVGGGSDTANEAGSDANGDDESTGNDGDDNGDGAGGDSGNEADGGEELDPEVAAEVEATAEQLLDAVDEALETGDISAADGLYLESCQGCYGRFDYYETIYADGGEIKGGRLLDREVTAGVVPDSDLVVVSVSGTSEAYEVIDGSGTVIDEGAEEDHHSLINFRQEDDGSWVAVMWE